jgi:phosphosulfolactate synthase (CoM biosynthesis protein A)
MWTMDWGRNTISINGPSQQVRKRLLLIKTDEGILHKIGVTCEDVDRFLAEAEKMGVNVIRVSDTGNLKVD